ncbi:MAG: BrnT family toxin [Deltaproteobacteria bacterium]|nr:BrnT family toxin [Deltaproteobacteria bacterium]
MPLFEYDPNKSEINEKQHGVNFVEAQELWEGNYVMIPAKDVKGENRSSILGKIEGKIYVAIFTQRGEKLRIISCHRAGKKWEKIYEQYLQEEKN